MRRYWSLMWLVGAVVGCSTGPLVSPIPEPPDGPDPEPDPDPERPRFDGMATISPCLNCDGSTVVGPPGTVSNADLVWGVNLDRVGPPATAVVEADGSFVLAMLVMDGDEIRLEAQSGDVHTSQAFVVIDETLALAPRPFADCFTVDPELMLGPLAPGENAAGLLTFTNDCDETLTIDQTRVRVPNAPLVLVDPPGAPFTVGPNGTFELNVELTAPGGFGDPIIEEVIVVDVSGPEVDRRSVHVWATAVP